MSSATTNEISPRSTSKREGRTMFTPQAAKMSWMGPVYQAWLSNWEEMLLLLRPRDDDDRKSSSPLSCPSKDKIGRRLGQTSRVDVDRRDGDDDDDDDSDDEGDDEDGLKCHYLSFFDRNDCIYSDNGGLRQGDGSCPPRLDGVSAQAAPTTVQTTVIVTQPNPANPPPSAPPPSTSPPSPPVSTTESSATSTSSFPSVVLNSAPSSRPSAPEVSRGSTTSLEDPGASTREGTIGTTSTSTTTTAAAATPISGASHHGPSMVIVGALVGALVFLILLVLAYCLRRRYVRRRRDRLDTWVQNSNHGFLYASGHGTAEASAAPPPPYSPPPFFRGRWWRRSGVARVPAAEAEPELQERDIAPEPGYAVPSDEKDGNENGSVDRDKERELQFRYS
ncbi:hypothetical protein MKEN_00982100 [Mycena kentingensis (nom. inval.)]|nr:hypothetical protein MKEN_00982100 [Mycena kentingensis (nom. inval.)]